MRDMQMVAALVGLLDYGRMSSPVAGAWAGQTPKPQSLSFDGRLATNHARRFLRRFPARQEPGLCMTKRSSPSAGRLLPDTGSSSSMRSPRVVCFHRAEGWYPGILFDGDDLGEHAARNPGTLKITDPLTGAVLWRPQ